MLRLLTMGYSENAKSATNPFNDATTFGLKSSFFADRKAFFFGFGGSGCVVPGVDPEALIGGAVLDDREAVGAVLVEDTTGFAGPVFLMAAYFEATGALDLIEKALPILWINTANPRIEVYINLGRCV